MCSVRTCPTKWNFRSRDDDNGWVQRIVGGIRVRRGVVIAWVIVVITGMTMAASPRTAADDRPPPLYADERTSLRTVSRTWFADDVCLPSAAAPDLTRLFDSEPANIIGADYQRATQIDEDTTLWTFQDAEVRIPGGGSRVVHNVGAVQEGNCFTFLMSGGRTDPQPWLYAEHTASQFRWFWPLGAAMGSDERLYVYLAEMNELGEEYLTHVVPSGTYVAAIDTTTWDVEWYGQPANGGADLYGFAIESDQHWTYLFAQCHRQFGYDPVLFVFGHDRTCADRVHIARVPRGQLLSPPAYWDGTRWQSSPTRAATIIETAGRLANPTQFIRHHNQWMAITKLDDWWGQRVIVERALHPAGPYQFYDERWPAVKCADDCNHYFASWIPTDTPSTLTFGLSHNRWDGVASWVYRPTFHTINAPGWQPTAASRCQLGQCD